MKRKRYYTTEYREDYLLNSLAYDPDYPGLQIHSFCHSFFTPQWKDNNVPMPFHIVSMVLSGRISYATQDGDYTVNDRNFLKIKDLNYSTDLFQVQKKINGSLERYFILFHTNHQLHAILSALFPQGLPHFIPTEPDKLRRCFEDIRRVLNRRGKTDNTLLGAMGYRLLVEIANQTDKPTNKPRALIFAQQYIENHFCTTSLNRDEIASSVGIDQTTLGCLFQEHLHTTVNHYIVSLRMEKAKNMLKNTYLSIRDISRECGFSYGYYFAKVFKEHTGISPKQYRENSQT